MGSSLLYSLETDVTDYAGRQGFLFFRANLRNPCTIIFCGYSMDFKSCPVYDSFTFATSSGVPSARS